MRTIRTNRARDSFLATLAETCNVSASASSAGISRTAAYAWRDDDEGFAAAWEEALETAADLLEQVAFERATGGGSDRMLEILLKAHRPKYREKQQVELSGGVEINHRDAARAEIEEMFGPTDIEVIPQ